MNNNKNQLVDILLNASDSFCAKISTSSFVSNSNLPISDLTPKYPPMPFPRSEMMISLPRLLSFTSPRQTVAILSSS